MLKRTITAITIAAFAANMGGCTHPAVMVDVYGEEASKYRKSEIEFVQLCSEIRIVTLTDQSVVQVDSNGLFLDTAANRVAFTDVNGQSQEYDIDKIKMVQSASGSAVKFINGGGRINAARQTVGGMRADSAYIDVPLEDVCYLQGITDKARLTPFGKALAVGVGGTLLYLMFKGLSEMEFIGGFGPPRGDMGG
jgi:hypothetical protein